MWQNQKKINFISLNQILLATKFEWIDFFEEDPDEAQKEGFWFGLWILLRISDFLNN